MSELPKYAVLSANEKTCIIPVTDPRRAYFDNSAQKLISFEDLKVSDIRYILSARHGINSPKLFEALPPIDALAFLMISEGFANDEILDYLAFIGYIPSKSNGGVYISQLVKEVKTVLNSSSNCDCDLGAYLKRVKQAHLYAHLINLLWLRPGNITIRKYSSYLVELYFKSDDVKLIIKIFKGAPPKDKGTIEKLIKILYLLHNGVELNNVAERFGISPSTVSSLLKRAIRDDLLRYHWLQ